MMNDDMKMYQNDDEAHAVALLHFEDASTLHAMYRNDDEAYVAAINYFEGVL